MMEEVVAIAMHCIEWCNANNGFLTGVMSFLTLLVSIIAIVVSIQTARLPYKKRILLSAGITYVATRDIDGQVFSKIDKIVISATNIGNRMVNITFLGLSVKPLFSKEMMLASINRDMGGTGIMKQTETISTEYLLSEIIGTKRNLSSLAYLYIFATDSEGKIYRKKYGRVGRVCGSLEKMLKEDEQHWKR